jgi:hypothetical protein
MADYDVKAVAAALREIADVGDQCGYATAKMFRKRADELDPPPPVKSRADRIVERLQLNYVSKDELDAHLRRILAEEGIE